jgi:hypothetical protein
MILDILTVLLFVLGFVLLLWMIGERRRDVIHGPYVTESTTARGDVDDGGLERAPTKSVPTPDVADELSRIAREIIEEEANSTEAPKG